MITKNVEGKYELDIFRNFSIDRNLPKHKKVEKSKYSNVSEDWGINVESGSVSVSNASSKKRFSFSKIFGRWNPFKKINQKLIELGQIPVEVVFRSVYEGMRELQIFEGRLENHKRAILYAEKMGQTALLEELRRKEGSILLENALFSAGFKQYIEEEDLIKFSLNSEKGLRLDWIKNFTRVIPEEAVDKKLNLDKLGIFDNYVIFHYDPEGKSTKLTDEERRKKEDPILFGVIQGSRRLYHVHSWIDKHCNLTIDQIIQTNPEIIKEIQ